MVDNAVAGNDLTFMSIEGALTVILFAVAFLSPRLGSRFFTCVERYFAALARHKRRVIAASGLAVVVLRLALLNQFPIPLPFIPDDFSFLMQADTFLHGRLANPAPALWTHFETIHLSVTPSYVSMYFPAQALVLALGKLVFGHPWFGLLAMSALMCAALVWAFQAWLPPGWALLGAVLVVLRLGLFSYWINTYTGAGSISAFAGALIVGALPRLMRRPRLRYGLALGMGAGLLVISRPFEGLLLCLPVTVYLLWWLLKGKKRPTGRALLRLALPSLAVLLAAIAWLGYYNYRAFGKATTMPYTVDRAQYAVTPYYVWQSLKPTPVYRHQALRAFYSELSVNHNGHSGEELDFYLKVHSLKYFVPYTLLKLLSAILFFASWALLPPLLMVRRLFLDRRMRLLVICALVLAGGMSIEIFLLPHYIAPFTVVFYVLGLQAMRHLRVWAPEKKPSGRFLVRVSVAICVLMAVARVVSVPLHVLPVSEWPASHWSGSWFGPDHYGTERAAIAENLEKRAGKQLVIVTDAPHKLALDEWVYNLADIDGSKVVWARDMGPANNLELIQYYRDRQVWRLDRGDVQAILLPYADQNADGPQTK